MQYLVPSSDYSGYFVNQFDTSVLFNSLYDVHVYCAIPDQKNSGDS